MISYSDNENTLLDCVEKIESFQFISNGVIKEIKNKSDEFFRILTKIETIFSNSCLMPAFGVSLHGETLNELKSGSWLQINFSHKITKNGLPFNSLLFQLEEVSGFNLIRLYNNRYDGRCLYLNLDENTNLLKLIQ